MTTKHGKTEHDYRKYEHPTLDATILVTPPIKEPLPASPYYSYDKFRKMMCRGEENYIYYKHEGLLYSRHYAVPGYSGSGVYQDGCAVAMCIAYVPEKNQGVFLPMGSLRDFIEKVLKEEKSHKSEPDGD